MSKFIESIIKMNQEPTLEDLQKKRDDLEKIIQRSDLGLSFIDKSPEELTKEWDDINTLIDEKVNKNYYPIQYY